MKREHHARIRTASSDRDAEKLLTLRGRLALTVETPEAGMRLDAFLACRLTWRSRTSIQTLIDTEQIEMQGRRPRASRRVQRGEEIFVRLPQPKRERLLGDQDLDWRILFEDRWLVAIDKPAGIPVHPSGRLLHKTVITELHHRYPVWRTAAFELEPEPVVPVDRAFDDGTVPPVVFDAVFVCRSGAWVPPWHDQAFIDFVNDWKFCQ